MKNIKKICFMCLALASACFVSCNDDDDCGSSPISVTQIYLEDCKDTVDTDRPVDFARLGQTIRIEGAGFCGMQKVYVNGYETYINTAYITDNSMLLTLNSKTPVMDAREEVRNTIQFVKTGTSYTYNFTIRASAPTVKAVRSTLPKPGETVLVIGENLHETTKVTLPGGVEVTDIESDEDGKWYAFAMPEGVTESGAILSEGANGKASSPAYFNYTSCMVLNFDNDGNGTQGQWSWEEGKSMLDDEHDVVDDPMASGRGKCVNLLPDRLIEKAVAGKTRVSECWTAGTGDEMDDWSRMFDFIPATTPLTDVAFQFDMYVPDLWNTTGYIQVVLYNNFTFSGIGSDDDGQRTAFVVPYIEDGAIIPYKMSTWKTVTIPFSEFGYYAKQIADEKTPTFQNVVDDRKAATYQNFGMGIVNTDFTWDGVSVTATPMTQKIYVDNWRVVPCAAIELSDFDNSQE